jgi:hypothetical protein
VGKRKATSVSSSTMTDRVGPLHSSAFMVQGLEIKPDRGASLAGGQLSSHRGQQIAPDQPRLHTQADLERSLKFFRDIRSNLEEVYPDDYVTVGVDTGQWVVGKSRYEASQNFEEKFGSAHKFTFHIGSTE